MPLSQAELELLISAKNEASRAIKEVEQDAGGLGKSLGAVGKIAGGFLAAEGVKAFGGFLIDATKAAADDAASVARLEQAMKNAIVTQEGWDGDIGDVNDAMNDWKNDIDDLISSGQKLGFTDDQTRDSLSLLTAQTGDISEATKRYALAQDLARGANIDVVVASKLLGKVTDENVNVLSRYGIAAHKGMTETELFGMVQEKFGGQAAAFGDSTAGKMEQVKIRIGELKEALGAQLLPIMAAVMGFLVSTAIPALEKFAQWIGPEIKKAIEDLKPTFADIKAAIAAVIGFIQANWPTISAVLGFVAEFVKAKIDGMIQVITSIVKIISEVVGFVSAIFHGEWAEAWEHLKAIASATLDLLIGYLKMVLGNIPGLILSFAGTAAQAAGDFAMQLVNKFMEFLGELPGKVGALFLQLIGDVRGYLLDLLGVVASGMAAVRDRALSIAKNLVDWVVEKFNDLVRIVTDKINWLREQAEKAAAFLSKIFSVIPGLAGGGPGSGLTWVGERGPELVNLPRGSYVYNHQQSQGMAHRAMETGGGSAVINIAINGGLNEGVIDAVAMRLRDVMLWERSSARMMGYTVGSGIG